MDVLSDLNIKPNSKIFIEPAQLGTDFQASLQFGNGSYTTNEFNLKVDNGALAINVASSDSNETAAISISNSAGTVFSSVPTVGASNKKLALAEDITTALTDYTTTADLQTLLNAKANKATTLSGYGITNAYTKSEADAKFIDNSSNEDIAGNKSFTGEVTINTLNATTLNLTNLNIEGVTTFSDVPVVGDSGKPLALEEDITAALESYTTTADLQTLLNAKANSATTLAGYGITDAYTSSYIDGAFVSRTADQIIEGTKTFSDTVKIKTLDVETFEVDSLEITESTTFGGTATFTNVPKVGTVNLALANEIPDDYIPNTATINGLTISDSPTLYAGNIALSASDATTVFTAIADLDTTKADKATTLSGYGITDAYTKTEIDNAFITRDGDESITGTKTFVDVVITNLTTTKLDIQNLNISGATAFATAPTVNGSSVVTTDGLSTILTGYQEKLTFDTTPTLDSTNPVTSGGLFAKFGDYITTSTADGKYVSRTEDQIIEGTKTFVDPVNIDTLNVADFSVDNFKITTSTTFNGTVTFASTPKVGSNNLALANEIPTDYIPNTATINGLTVATNPTLYAGDIKISSTDATTIATAISDLESTKADKATTLAGYGITDAYTSSFINDNFISRTEDQTIEGTKTFADPVTIDTLNVTDFSVDNLEITDTTTFGSIPTVSGKGSLALKSEIPTDYVSTSNFNTALEGKADVGVSYTKAESDSLLSNYVSINGNETITGTKTFSDAVNINQLSVNSFAVDSLTVSTNTTFNGTINVPAVASTDSSTKAASTAFVHSVVEDKISSLGTVLNYKGVATSISDDFVTITTSSGTVTASSKNVGDVYIIPGTENNSGIEYVSDGSIWQKIGYNTDLSGYQEKLTFDTTPVSGSLNPVTSGGLFAKFGDYITTSDADGKYVALEGEQTITGTKIFSDTVQIKTLGVETFEVDSLKITESTTFGGTTTFTNVPKVGTVNLALANEIPDDYIPNTATINGLTISSSPTLYAGNIAISASNATTVAASITDLDTTKADKATTLSGYGITNAYTKSEADAKFIDNSSNEDIGGNKSFTGEVTINTLNATTLNLTNLNIEGVTTFSDVPVVGDSGKPLALEEDISNALANYTTTTDLQALLNAKANSATTLAGYGITDAYTSSYIDGAFVSRTADQIIEGTKTFSDTVKIKTLDVETFEVDSLEITESTTFGGTATFTNVPKVGLDELALYNQIPTDYVTETQLTEALAAKANSATTLAGYGITDAYTSSYIDGAFVSRTADQIIEGTKTFSGTVNIDTLNVTDFAVGNLEITSSTSFGGDVSFATTPSVNGNQLITSSALDSTLSGYQTKLTFDSTPDSGSSNPVTSSGIKSALDNYVDKSSEQTIAGPKTFTGDVTFANIFADSFNINDLVINGDLSLTQVPTVNSEKVMMESKYVEMNVPAMAVGTTSVTMTLSTTFTKRPILQLMRVSDGEVVMATLNYKLENGTSKVTISIAHTEAITAGQYVLHAFGV